MPYFCFKLWSLTAVLRKLLILPIQSNCCLCLKREMEKCCAFYQWNWLAAMNAWKNLRFNFRLIAVVFCIWNLADRFWLKCSSKCILAITFKYLKHYWRTENENARSLYSCACVCRKSVLLILRITAKTQRLLHSWAILKFVEPTWLFESSHTFICSVSSVIFSYSSGWKHM